MEHKKMPISERAKQFMPFSALNGLNKALRKKEESMDLIERPILSADLKDEINLKLKILDRRLSESTITNAQISFFNEGKRVTVDDSILGINKEAKSLITKNGEILIEDLIDLDLIS